MGFLSPKVSSGPTPEELKADEKKRKKREALALRAGLSSNKSRQGRASLKRNPGLTIPGG